jgi:type IV pilus biogenesis protein PilP
VAPEKAQSTRRTSTKISKPQKEAPTQSPLFEALKTFKDPFRKEDSKLAELQDKLSLTQKEIEYLKATLEEKKLRREIKEIEKVIRESAGTSTPGTETEIESLGGKKGEAKSQKSVLVKAISISDDEKSALILSGDKKAWVHEGEMFDGWEIKEIRRDSVVLLRASKTYVFFCDRPGTTREGES